MKKYLYLSFALLLAVGCVKEDFNEQLRNGTDLYPVFYADISSTAEETKTYLDGYLDDYFLYWNADDRISVFSSTYNQQYRFTGETGDNSGSFAKVQEDGFVTGNDIDGIYAVYPYSPQTTFGDDGILITLPATQQYAKNSFGVGANTMVAATKNKDDNFLSFNNLCGFLRVMLYGEDVVKSISFTGKNGEKIAGPAKVSLVYGEEPELTIFDSATEKITLDCGSGVELGKTEDEATSFWFVIPPITFSKGYTVEIVNDEGCSMVRSISSSKTFERNYFRTMLAIETKFNNVYFEDANFKAYCVGKFDTDNNGQISLAEAAAVTEIDCSLCSISSLVGIEHFTSLEYLDCSTNRLTNLDLSKNTALNQLRCYRNDLTSLDLSKNTDLNILICYRNQLTSLDLSKNTALEYLDCLTNQLTSLDVSKNTALEYLDCATNQITSLDVSNNTALEFLYCDNNQLTSLDVSKNTALEVLYCAPMSTLSTLYVASGQSIYGVTQDRDPYHIPSATEIVVIEGPQMVDLGLSVKWATFNIGANSPYEYGDYYAWGETETKSVYSWANYKYCNGSNTTMTKYCLDTLYGTVDNKTVLDPEDDVASVKWGESWRMPTADEWLELKQNCTWKLITIGDDVYVFKVSGTKEGYTDNFIFLPVNGCYIDNNLYYYDGCWASTLTPTNNSTAHHINLVLNWVYNADRCEGRPVRPVSD